MIRTLQPSQRCEIWVASVETGSRELVYATDNDGHLYRADLNGGEATRITADDGFFETVDWFPHISPDGRFASYRRFPAGTTGHPADLHVDVVVVSTSDWTTPLHIWPLFGGQGTINVNSWSRDSTRFAYVAYPASSSD